MVFDLSQTQQKKAWKQEVLDDIKQAHHQAECDREETKNKIDALTTENKALQEEMATVQQKAETDRAKMNKKIDTLETENQKLKGEIIILQQNMENERMEMRSN